MFACNLKSSTRQAATRTNLKTKHLISKQNVLAIMLRWAELFRCLTFPCSRHHTSCYKLLLLPVLHGQKSRLFPFNIIFFYVYIIYVQYAYGIKSRYYYSISDFAKAVWTFTIIALLFCWQNNPCQVSIRNSQNKMSGYSIEKPLVTAPCRTSSDMYVALDHDIGLRSWRRCCWRLFTDMYQCYFFFMPRYSTKQAPLAKIFGG